MNISMYFLSDYELLIPSEPSAVTGEHQELQRFYLGGSLQFLWVFLSGFHKSCVELPPFCVASEIPNFCLLWRVNFTESCRILEIKINLSLQVSKNIMNYNCMPQECLCKWHLRSRSCPSCYVKITGNKESTAISVFKVDWILTDFAQCCRKVSSLPPEEFKWNWFYDWALTGLTTELWTSIRSKSQVT